MGVFRSKPVTSTTMRGWTTTDRPFPFSVTEQYCFPRGTFVRWGVYRGRVRGGGSYAQTDGMTFINLHPDHAEEFGGELGEEYPLHVKAAQLFPITEEEYNSHGKHSPDG